MFVEEDEDLYDVVFKHASQNYAATERKINEANFKVSGKKIDLYQPQTTSRYPNI